jgi:hypothetical protein
MAAARVLLTLVLVLASGRVRAGESADANLDILRSTIRANKKALVAANLTLSDEEATKFWPLYDEYQKKLTAVNDRMVELIKDYTTHFKELTDEHALKLAEQYLDVEKDRNDVRREYLPQFAKILPGRKVARFFQIENKMEAVVRYDLASEIPVVEEAAAR